ncbi:MAG: CBS domain-containing protein [Thermodesulfobacteriota bacterium]
MDTSKLADILTTEVISVAPATKVSEALRLMRAHHVSCILVTEGGRPAGIVTERNLVRLIPGQGPAVDSCEVRAIMSTPVITAGRQVDIFEAYSLFSAHHLRHLAVVDEDERLVGVVTLTDIVEHLSFESFVEMKRIAQVMTRVVLTVPPETDVREALVRMAERSMSCIVITEGRQPVGIISERDVSRLLLDYPDLSQVRVGEVMSRSLQSVAGDTPLPLAIEIMKRKRLRRLVVADSDGTIEGLATQSDMVKGLEGKYIQALNEIIKEKDFVIREKDFVIHSTSLDLAEKTTYLDNILQSAIDYGIIAVGLDQRVTYFNPGAEQIFGLRSATVLGRDLSSLHGGQGPVMSRIHGVLGILHNGERSAFLIERQRAGGKQHLSARASAIIDRQGKITGYVLMVHDITERKLAEEALRKAHDELELRVAERTEELAKTVSGTVEAMALIVEMRDPYTAGHQQRVANLAAALALKLGFDSHRVEGVHMAGVLHDIGKIRVPSDILCHPGRLSAAELAILKPHPEIGFNILRGIEFPWPLAETVRQHHERLDGSGYPHGLTGEGIQPAARILAIADVVEALSSHRPYRPALGLDRALAEISAGRGSRYDVQAVDACLSLFLEDGYTFPEHRRDSGLTFMGGGGPATADDRVLAGPDPQLLAAAPARRPAPQG